MNYETAVWTAVARRFETGQHFVVLRQFREYELVEIPRHYEQEDIEELYGEDVAYDTLS